MLYSFTCTSRQNYVAAKNIYSNTYPEKNNSSDFLLIGWQFKKHRSFKKPVIRVPVLKKSCKRKTMAHIVSKNKYGMLIIGLIQFKCELSQNYPN